MNTYKFALALTGLSVEDEMLEDALFEAGCDDALLNFCHGAVYLHFDRESCDLKTAVLSAIRDVESAKGFNAKVVAVEPPDLVTLSEIANRSGFAK